MKKVLLTLAMAACTVGSMAAAGHGRIVVARAGFGGGFGGGYYAPYPGAYFGAPMGGYYGYPNAGEVKLDTKVRDAEVFINGAYAGTTRDNRTMRLRPGQYNIEIRAFGQTRFAERVYVVAGKTMHIRPVL
jgi:hypothetical protein